MKSALEAVADHAKNNSSFEQLLKTDPQTALRSETAQNAVEAAAYHGDRTFYRVAIGGLVGVILLVLVFAFVLEVGWSDKNLPTLIVALGTTALGALVGLFAPPPGKAD